MTLITTLSQRSVVKTRMSSSGCRTSERGRRLFSASLGRRSKHRSARPQGWETSHHGGLLGLSALTIQRSGGKDIPPTSQSGTAGQVHSCAQRHLNLNSPWRFWLSWWPTASKRTWQLDCRDYLIAKSGDTSRVQDSAQRHGSGFYFKKRISNILGNFVAILEYSTIKFRDTQKYSHTLHILICYCTSLHLP